jgi:hypothetical protein
MTAACETSHCRCGGASPHACVDACVRARWVVLLGVRKGLKGELLAEGGDAHEDGIDVAPRDAVCRRNYPAEEVGAAFDGLEPDHGVAGCLHRGLDARRYRVDGMRGRQVGSVWEGSERRGDIPEGDVGARRRESKNPGAIRLLAFAQLGGEVGGEGEGVVDPLRQALVTESLPQEPQLEAVGLAAALDGLVADVVVIMQLVRLEEVGCVRSVGRAQHARVACDEERALEGRAEHLVQGAREGVTQVRALRASITCASGPRRYGVRARVGATRLCQACLQQMPVCW